MHRFVKINEASLLLGYSVDTLRRWDKKDKLNPDRRSDGGHRYYSIESLEQFAQKLDKLKMAKTWVEDEEGFKPLPTYHCSDSYIFQSRLQRFEQDLIRTSDLSPTYISLVVSVVGEIGDNSYNHNIGKWPDIVGIFFGVNILKGLVVLADRGLGVFHTLNRVTDVRDDSDALNIAFTKVISGRSPENRGNGLKFVKRAVKDKRRLNLKFRTGDSIATIKDDLVIKKADSKIQGCLAEINFKNEN